MAGITKSSQIGEQLSPTKPGVILVVAMELHARATSLTLTTIGMPIALTDELPLGALDVSFVLFAEFECHDKEQEPGSL
jgi:hypothetical protein